MSYEALVVGSGAAGLAAALGLEGRRTAIVDVGFEAPPERLSGNLYEQRASGEDLDEALLGARFESLAPLYQAFSNQKLTSPSLRHVTQDADTLSRIESDSFVALMSFARGGLANAWGAGAYRFDADELAHFPFGPEELAPYYARLTPILGVSGCSDDLAPFVGSAEGLDPPIELDALSRLFLRRYEANRERFQRAGLHVGRSRLAVATRDRPNRPAYAYRGVDFFEPESAVFNPGRTLAEWAQREDVDYCPQRLALSYRESESGVHLQVRNLQTGELEELTGKRLLLAAGTLGSAKLVLASRQDHQTSLPLLDNPNSYIPLLAPERIGAAQETRFFGGGQLNVLYRGTESEEPVHGTFYGLSGVLRSDFLMRLPIAARDLVTSARSVGPALAVIQLFYAEGSPARHHLRLTAKGALSVNSQPAVRGVVESRVLKAVRRLGFFGLAALCQYPAGGSSFHYAGTLPMRARPSLPYETDATGRLEGTRAVYVCDASTFPHLPAKNLTFTAMANALRIASGVAETLRT